MQDSKHPIITTEYMEPREWIPPTPPTNNEGATTNSAVAACNPPPEILADPLQPSKILLHSWLLYTPEAPVLDLRGKKVTSTLNLADIFHELHLCSTDSDPQEESSSNGRRKRQKKPTNLNKQLSDSDTSDDEPINPKSKTLVEERHNATIQGLALATQAVLSHTCAQANPAVACRPNCTKTIKKLTKEAHFCWKHKMSMHPMCRQCMITTIDVMTRGHKSTWYSLKKWQSNLKIICLIILFMEF